MTHAILHPERSCDREAVEALLQAALNESLPWPASVLPQLLALRVAGQLSIVRVATVSGSLAGYIAFTPVSADTAQEQWHLLQALVVAPAVRQLGIGSALMRCACSALAHQGASGCLVLGGSPWFTAQGFQPLSGKNVLPEAREHLLLARSLGQPDAVPPERLQLPWACSPRTLITAAMH
ncbi:GNAT family N-acetyltransferase [Chitinilyticum piscinae]|uniref:N-acetyltransferase n=1 Tax=Chitinilyticum piscinae TaxID=2866724 RepID=A0A8J7K2I8_9NEIS|nr:GNAT family N-acetyltransferase [Chitinilyticum piscinae]MBE9610087.1 N-acetyltransferase [Chitinilyticum piscinae]